MGETLPVRHFEESNLILDVSLRVLCAHVYLYNARSNIRLISWSPLTKYIFLENYSDKSMIPPLPSTEFYGDKCDRFSGHIKCWNPTEPLRFYDIKPIKFRYSKANALFHFFFPSFIFDFSAIINANSCRY